ncbi:DUF1674 domain-containing protein [Wenzhouxiangella marina]|uniref:Uncharacterized protein n=1 Tax=Wenzhouxiangella marina TaxID=1579979 RepID=A0A0K0XX24_9GAMM|nr:DUF1674 domain-containing protein [Wenzhouxiangella marina]AKS42181.1 hypothetical protein WM2015_1814 [Wenzhouxiangella marina]MBB6086047.1 hypothetical protein [Wenzhouxiangella marina]
MQAANKKSRRPGDPPVDPQADRAEPRPKEIGGRKKGLEPTRYGDWEKNGRCIDF